MNGPADYAAETVLAELEYSRGRPAESRAAAEQALSVRRETGHRITDADPARMDAHFRRIVR